MNRLAEEEEQEEEEEDGEVRKHLAHRPDL